MHLTREYAVECLRRAVGRDDADFREGQWEAIDGVLQGRRQIVVQRTGWGKSMIYFLATRFLREQGRGMTLLISPLLALMRNQVAASERAGVKCFTINSMNPNEWDGIREKILAGGADLLIVSPERLASRLGLPCVPALAKVVDTSPQKAMENAVFQQNNVLDAFAVAGTLPKGGCWLVDDMVDSRWTFTVAAATLRQAGVEFVIPLALADSSNEGE